MDTRFLTIEKNTLRTKTRPNIFCLKILMMSRNTYLP